MSVFGSQRRRQSDESAVRENQAREARSYHRVRTTGWGEVRIAERLDFSVDFAEEPFVATGFSLDGETLVDTRFPRACGYVTEWDIDTRGNYVGCWVACVVETMGAQADPDEPDDPNYEIDWSFTFSGVAAKTVPVHLLRG